ncbi:hypothetical protein P3L10_025707 [Capsicum annuum]|uniref:uncharacterized protein LOC107841883 n=1 Tax=Capsicum annuum TaxID=4072 RepID=UPI0007BEFFE5|nr:uncharacterized protein LOC107841883 [Capsicum annuum]
MKITKYCLLHGQLLRLRINLHGGFLELLKNDLDLGEGHQLSIISDMQKAGASNGRGRGRERGSGPSHVAGTSYQQKVSISGRGKGSGREREMNQESQTNFGIKRGVGRGKPPQRQDYEDSSGGYTRPYKRPRMVGIGIYQAEDGFTPLNPEMLSRRVIITSAKVTKKSDIVTSDIGYTLR